MAYSDKVVDHYNNPRNVGSFAKDTPGVGTGLVGAPECGDVMKLQVKVNLDTGVIGDAKVKELKQAQNLPETVFLRMGVKGGGCSGMSYALEFDSEIGPHDKQFEIDGIKIVVDKKSYLYLNGTTLDYVQQGLTGGFTFVNPSAKSSCGCGTSFSA